MKALSLTQPWAQLVAIGAKGFETRSWSTSYRGPLAIHASKSYPREAREFALDGPAATALIVGMQRYALAYRHQFPDDLPRGAIIAVARLVNVLPTVDGKKLPVGQDCVALCDEGFARKWTAGNLFGQPGHVGEIQWHEHEAAFGDYTPGRFAWLLEDVRPLREPIPCSGALSLWDVPATIAPALEAVAARGLHG